MAGTSRFHDKIHRANHHSVATPGLPDSSHDPIASSDAPFRGDFVLSGALSAVGNGEFAALQSRSTLQASSATTLNSTLYVGGATTQRGAILINNSGGVITTDSYPVTANAGAGTLSLNFNKGVYINGTFGSAPKLVLGVPGVDAGVVNASNVVAASAALVNLTVSNSANIAHVYTPDALVYTLSSQDGVFVGGRLGVGTSNPQHSMHVIGDVVIYGDLTANGTSNFQNTTFTTTSALSIVNTGTGAALTVSQEGNQAVAAFYDHESSIGLWIDGDVSRPGWVGVRTKTPNVELTVAGSISASGQLYGTLDKTFVTGYTRWDSVYNSVSATSATWNACNTTTNINSASWSSSYNTLNPNSASWTSNYNTTNANSATWGAGAGSAAGVYTTLNANSARWNSDYTTLNNNSAAWSSNYTTTNSTSSNWSGVYTSTNTNSASWVSNYSTTNANSATWSASSITGSSTYTTLNTNSAKWDSSYTTTNSNSSTWNLGSSAGAAAYNTLTANSAKWDSSYTTTNTNSAAWDSTYTSVYANSAAWDAAAGGLVSLDLASLNDVLFVTPLCANQLLTYDATSALWVNSSYFNDAIQTLSGTQSTVISNSGSWSSAYTTTNANSANWSSSYNIVDSNSANWSNAYTTTNANSANWSSVYTTTDANSANWSSAYTTTNTNSANWSSSYASVLANSATWSLPGVTALSALGDVSITSPTNNQVLQYDSATNTWKNGTAISTSGTLSAGNIDLTNATISTFEIPLTASGDFLVIRLNGTERKLQLWD